MAQNFLLDVPAEIEHRLIAERYERYYTYLESIKDHIPPSTYAFATAPWHYDPRDPRCPHDAWIEFFSIQERAKGTRSENRTLELHMRLLGAYHNGYIELAYVDVQRYHIERISAYPSNVAHGDWLIDEIRLSELSLVIHEIRFVHAKIYIECRDITYSWIPKPQSEATKDE